MLMFRAGLRPNELIGLEYRHIQGAPLDHSASMLAKPILYLHATSREVLKTPSGVRQIPLAWFLCLVRWRNFGLSCMTGCLQSRTAIVVVQ
jgi:hypothetical protein